LFNEKATSNGSRTKDTWICRFVLPRYSKYRIFTALGTGPKLKKNFVSVLRILFFTDANRHHNNHVPYRIIDFLCLLHSMLENILKEPLCYSQFVDEHATPDTMEKLLSTADHDGDPLKQVQILKNVSVKGAKSGIVSTGLKTRYGHLIGASSVKELWTTIFNVALIALYSPLLKCILKELCKGMSLSRVPAYWWETYIRKYTTENVALLFNEDQGKRSRAIHGLCAGLVNLFLQQANTLHGNKRMKSKQSTLEVWSLDSFWTLFVEQKVDVPIQVESIDARIIQVLMISIVSNVLLFNWIFLFFSF